MADTRQRVRYRLLPGGKRLSGVVEQPLRVGYAQECDLVLEGGDGPPILFEIHKLPGPLQIATRVPPADIASHVELAVDGRPLDESVREFQPGGRLDVVDKASGRRYRLVVEPPSPWLVRPRFLAAAMVILTALGASYGTYLYMELEAAYGSLARTQDRVKRTEAALDEASSRIASTESRLAGAVGALARERAASEQALRADLDMRLDALGRRARKALAEIAEEDTQARDDLRGEMVRGLATLREDFAARMVESFRHFKSSEQEVLSDLGRRIQAMEPETERFKRVLAAARDAVLFIHTSYRVRVERTGEEQRYDSFGTGFLVGPNGLALTAQHVLFPWRYERELILLGGIGAVAVIEDDVHWSVWLTDTTVLDAPATSPGERGAEVRPETAFNSDSDSRAVRFLYAPPADLSEEQVASPIGMLRLQVPQPGASDVAVFRLEGHDGTFTHLEIAPDGTPLESLDELLAVGYPFSRLQAGVASPQGVRGFVRRAGEGTIEVDVPLHPGLSGAPLLNVRGEVMGMASAVFQSALYGVASRYQSLTAAIAAARGGLPEQGAAR